MAIQTTPQTILLKAKNLQGQLQKFILGAAAKPGHFVVPDPSNAGECIKNALTTGADTQLMILVENYLAGGVITDAYSAGDQVEPYQPIPGDELYARLPAGASAVVEGDRLQLDNTGCCIKLASGVEKLRALEAVDNSGGGSEVFIKVRAI